MRLSYAALLAATLLLPACQPVDPTMQGARTAAQAREDTAKPAFLLRLARASRAAGDTGTAVNLYRQAMAKSGADITPHLELAELLLVLEDKEGAKAALREATAAAPSNTEGLRKLANYYINTGAPDQALPLLDKALAVDSGDARLYSSRGVALDMLGKHQEARAAYATGLEAAPSNPFLRTNLGMSYILTGEYTQAVDTLKAVAEGADSTPQARQNLAMAYGLSGQTQNALAMGTRDMDEEHAKQNLAFYENLTKEGFGAQVAEDKAVTPVAQTPQEEEALAAYDGDEMEAEAPPAEAEIASTVEKASARYDAAHMPLPEAQVAAAEIDQQTHSQAEAPAIEAHALLEAPKPFEQGGWYLDLGSYRTLTEAQKQWEALVAEHPDALADESCCTPHRREAGHFLVGPFQAFFDVSEVCAVLGGHQITCNLVHDAVPGKEEG